MRQSIGPVISAIKTRVESILPLCYEESTFTTPPGNLGAADAVDWIEDVMRLTREFVVYVSGLPKLTASSAPCHVSTQLSVAVVYRAELADDVRDVMVADDVNSIISAVISRPDLWGGADGVWPVNGGATLAAMIDAEQKTQTYVATIPFEVITH